MPQSPPKTRPVTIGVLALQGAYDAHRRMLSRLGIDSRGVRTPRDLDGLAGLIIPGGESSTLLHFLSQDGFWDALKAFAATHPCLGTCAGLILLAREVEPAQPSLGLLDIAVQRNGYGRQQDSHVLRRLTALPGPEMEMVFIRAPRILSSAPGVDILAMAGNEPVLVRQGTVIGCAFHPELGTDTRVHTLLIDSCRTP